MHAIKTFTVIQDTHKLYFFHATINDKVIMWTSICDHACKKGSFLIFIQILTLLITGFASIRGSIWHIPRINPTFRCVVMNIWTSKHCESKTSETLCWKEKKIELHVYRVRLVLYNYHMTRHVLSHLWKMLLCARASFGRLHQAIVRSTDCSVYSEIRGRTCLGTTVARWKILTNHGESNEEHFYIVSCL